MASDDKFKDEDTTDPTTDPVDAADDIDDDDDFSVGFDDRSLLVALACVAAACVLIFFVP